MYRNISLVIEKKKIEKSAINLQSSTSAQHTLLMLVQISIVIEIIIDNNFRQVGFKYANILYLFMTIEIECY